MNRFRTLLLLFLIRGIVSFIATVTPFPFLCFLETPPVRLSPPFLTLFPRFPVLVLYIHSGTPQYASVPVVSDALYRATHLIIGYLNNIRAKSSIIESFRCFAQEISVLNSHDSVNAPMRSDRSLNIDLYAKRCETEYSRALRQVRGMYVFNFPEILMRNTISCRIDRERIYQEKPESLLEFVRRKIETQRFRKTSPRSRSLQ